MPKRKEHIIKNNIEYKECSKCKIWLPLVEYSKDNSKWDGSYGFCKSCAKGKDRKIYLENPKKNTKKSLNIKEKRDL
jgi:hypothetical protein